MLLAVFSLFKALLLPGELYQGFRNLGVVPDEFLVKVGKSKVLQIGMD